ncbi:ferredoxin [Candidatus Woesearchaeota archaeon]|nr:ferredoxin [Candidatus Woesearchaeota archaeon]
MAKYKITFDREACIGAIACVSVNPKYWLTAEDGKVDLKGAKKNKDGKWELIIGEEDFVINRDSAEVCPVLAIKVEKVEE